jgi:steroid delta-isomerase-like uncharacterized protein
MTTKTLEKIDDLGMAAWNAHDANAFLSVFADDFVWQDWTQPEPIRTKEQAAHYFNSWMTAFPDMKAKEISRVVGPDAIAVEIEFTGTNTGPLSMGGMELPPTNKAVVGRGTYTAFVRDGKIIEYHTHPDAAGLMMQLGLMPQS